MPTPRELQTRFITAQSAVVNSFNPSDKQWEEYEAAAEALKAAEKGGVCADKSD